MLNKLWKENRPLILVSLLLFLILTLIMILGAGSPSDMPFDYQIR